MTVTPTEATLQSIVGGLLKIPPNDVPVDRPLLELDLDSLDVIRAIGEIEKAFAPISLPMEGEGFRTLRDLARYIDLELAKT